MDLLGFLIESPFPEICKNILLELILLVQIQTLVRSDWEVVTVTALFNSSRVIIRHRSNGFSSKKIKFQKSNYEQLPFITFATIFLNETHPSSVTRWRVYFFNIWPFTTVKNYPIESKHWQSWRKLIPKKWPKTFNYRQSG